MIIEKIILSITAIMMLSLSFKKGNLQTILLTSGLTIGILITWSGESMLISTGRIIYMITALLISIFNLKTKEVSKFNRFTIVLSGLFAFCANVFSIMHWPFVEIIRLIMIIPILLYLLSLFKGILKRQEMGYLTIMNVGFFMRFI